MPGLTSVITARHQNNFLNTIKLTLYHFVILTYKKSGLRQVPLVNFMYNLYILSRNEIKRNTKDNTIIKSYTKHCKSKSYLQNSALFSTFELPKEILAGA